MSLCSCDGELTVSLQNFLQRANSVGVWPLLEDSLGQWVQLHGTKTQRENANMSVQQLQQDDLQSFFNESQPAPGQRCLSSQDCPGV